MAENYNATPVVSIIIPAFNVLESLPNALESIEKQTYKNIEVVIVDDCSYDNLDVRLPELKSEFPTLNLNVKRTDYNHTKAYSLNRGIEISSGEFLTFMYAHDTLPEESIEKRLSYLTSTHEKAVIGKTVFLGYESHDELMQIFFLNEKSYHPNSLMAKRDVIDEIGFFDEELERFEGVDFALKVISRFGVGTIDDAVYNNIRMDHGFFQNLKIHKIERNEWKLLKERHNPLR